MSTLPLLPAATVKLDGTALSPEVESLLVSLRMRDSLRLPDQATLRLADPQLVRVDDGLLAVGKKLEIACAPPGSSTETTVFSGPIQSIELELVGEGAFIAATAYEPAFALHRNRRTRAFQDMTPADVAQQVISGAGLSASVTSSGGGGVSQKFLLQNDETDWDLLWRLADAIDYEVVGDGTTVHFRAAGASSGGAIALKAPDQLLSFRPRITGVQQVDSVTVRGWDPSTAEAIVADKSVPSPDTELGVQRASVASAAGGGTWAVADRTVVSQAEADALAQSLAARMGNAWVEADGVTAGDPRLGAGVSVSVTGVGDRFAGTYVITSVTHVFVGGRGYQTQFTISGRAARSLLALVESGRPAAPWGAGTVVGVVTQTEDPDGLGRIRVRHPALGDNAEGWWARIASPAAGQARGLLMMPVAGDEVVVAFEQGDPRRPYVLGSVWNGNAKPGQDLVKSDGSFVLASDHAVTITAAEDATITATQKALTLKGNQVTAQSDAAFKISGATVTIESDGAVSIKGASITVEAQAALTLKASGAMQVSAASVMFQ